MTFLNLKVSTPEVRDACIEALGKEFYSLFLRSAQLQDCIIDAQKSLVFHLGSRTITAIVEMICHCLRCERATVWVVDKVRRIFWTRVESVEKMRQITMQLHLPDAVPPEDYDGTGKGLVVAGYMTNQIINVVDAHQDPRFNKNIDFKTGYRTKSVLVYPQLNDDDDTKERRSVVLQAINKKEEPGWFNKNDLFVLDLIGKLSVEMIEISESSAKDDINGQRKDALISYAAEMMKNTNDLGRAIKIFKKGMEVMFLGKDVEIHLSYGEYTKRLEIVCGKVSAVDPKIPPETKKQLSIVMEAIRLRQIVYLRGHEFLDHPKYMDGIDISIPQEKAKNMVVYTVPLFQKGGTITGVIQFSCEIEDRKTHLDDERTFSSLNRSHRLTLERFTQFLCFAIEHEYPLVERRRGMLLATFQKSTKHIQKLLTLGKQGNMPSDTITYDDEWGDATSESMVALLSTAKTQSKRMKKFGANKKRKKGEVQDEEEEDGQPSPVAEGAALVGELFRSKRGQDNEELVPSLAEDKPPEKSMPSGKK